MTDRLCVVLSGMWWCNSGPDFDPGQAGPSLGALFMALSSGTLGP